MPSNFAQRPSFLFASLFSILIVGFLGYCNSLEVPFLFDDMNNIVSEQNIQTLDLKKIWDGNTLRSVTVFTFALNYRWGRLSPFGFHLFNLLIHLGCAIMVFLLVRLLLTAPFSSPRSSPEKSDVSTFIPLFAALLFVSHPIQTQAVTYVVQRAASLATFFYVSALYFYLAGRLSWNKDKRKSGACFFFVSVCTLFAFFTKEISATLPFALFAVEFFFLGWPDRKNVLRLAMAFFFPLFALLSALWLFKRPIFMAIFQRVFEGIPQIRTSHYLLTQCNVIGTYLRMLLVPIGQNLDYDYPIAQTLWEMPTLLSFSFLVALWVWGGWLWRKNRLASFAIFFFFLALSVESSILPLEDVIFEHRLYLPSLGFVIFAAVAWSHAGKWWKRESFQRTFCWTLAGLIVGACTYATHRRNQVWQSPISLWQDTVRKSPLKSRVHNNLGIAYEQGGKYPEAFEAYRTALKLDPKDERGYLNLGRLYRKMGRTDEAISYYRKAIERNPRFAGAYFNLGVLYESLGNEEEAMRHYREALEKDSALSEACLNIGNIHYRRGEYERAREFYGKAIRLFPRFAQAHYNLGIVCSIEGRLEEAVGHWEKALSFDPGHRGAAEKIRQFGKRGAQ